MIMLGRSQFYGTAGPHARVPAGCPAGRLPTKRPLLRSRRLGTLPTLDGRRIDLALAIGLIATAVVLRLTVLAVHPFDGLYGQDAYAYYDYARQLFGAIRGGALNGPFYWPLGYPLLVAPLFFITGISPLAGQIVSLITGALIAPLAYLIAREVFRGDEIGGRRAGLAAGLVIATSGQLMQSSIVVMSDAPALFWATFSLWALLRFTRLRRARWLIAAVASLALATITRWLMGILAVPWGLYLLADLRRQDRSERGRVVRAGSIGLVCAALIVLTQLRLDLYAPHPFWQHAWVTSWDLTHAFRSTFDNADGHFDYNLPVALFNLLPFYHPFYLFPLLAPSIILGAWLLRRSGVMILIAGWIAVIYGFLIGIPYENFRFPLGYLMPAALLAGIGFDRLATRRAGWARGMLGLSLIGMLIFAGRGILFDSRSLLFLKQRDLAAADWLRSHIPAGAQMITFSITLTLQHYTDLDVVEVFDETPQSLAARVCRGRTIYAFFDTDSIESQWRGRSPEINYRWLRDGPGLEAIDRFDRDTLFKVGNHCR